MAAGGILMALALTVAVPALAVAEPREKMPLPPGYRILANVRVDAGNPRRGFRIVALGEIGEAAGRRNAQGAPARPLLIFAERGGRWVPSGRNDHVVLRADEGGQCDPFLDSDATISVKGRYFTVENGVACGQHWTDFITFRLDDRAGFVFDNERTESWSLNPSDAPNASAMVRDGAPTVRRAKRNVLIRFSEWRPDR